MEKMLKKQKIKISWLFIFLAFLLLCGQLFLGWQIDFPPYPEELIILVKSQSLFQGQSAPAFLTNLLGATETAKINLFPLRSYLQVPFGAGQIWALRLVNFILINSSLGLLFLVGRRLKITFNLLCLATLFCLVSPLTFWLWLFEPQLSLTFFLVSFWFYLWFVKKVSPLKTTGLFLITISLLYTSFSGLIMALFVLIPWQICQAWRKKDLRLIALLILFTLLFFIPTLRNPTLKQFWQETTLSPAFSSSQLSQVVTQRFTNEDSLLEKVEFPLWFRRLGYNKLFFAYRHLIQEPIKFFDLETIFFQEVHPLNQKAIVLFYWPQIFLFASGLFWLLKSDWAKLRKLLIPLISIAFIFFLFSLQMPTGKFLFLLWPLALILALGFTKLPKFLSLPLGLLLLWAVIINGYDLFSRPLYWFDNRPYVYQQGLQTLFSNSDFKEKKNLYLTSLIGNPKIYFYYYQQPEKTVFLTNSEEIDHQGQKIFFRSFDLGQEKVNNETIYFGFLGEFLGSRFKNDFGQSDLDLVADKNLKLTRWWKLDNTIAFQYSDYFLLATTND